jgi:hypothetical protein
MDSRRPSAAWQLYADAAFRSVMQIQFLDLFWEIIPVIDQGLMTNT